MKKFPPRAGQDLSGGRTDPHLSTPRKLADALGVTLDALAGA